MKYIDSTNSNTLRFDSGNKIYLHFDSIDKDVYVSARTDEASAMITYMLSEGPSGSVSDVNNILDTSPVYSINEDGGENE